MIKITSASHNFRRCGMPHPKGSVEYPDDRFSEDDLAILKTEPMLTVETQGPVETHGRASLHPAADDLIDAARAAIDAGDITKDGKPEVRAIEEILGRDITAAERDEAWNKIEGSKNGQLYSTGGP